MKSLSIIVKFTTYLCAGGLTIFRYQVKGLSIISCNTCILSSIIPHTYASKITFLFIYAFFTNPSSILLHIGTSTSSTCSYSFDNQIIWRSFLPFIHRSHCLSIISVHLLMIAYVNPSLHPSFHTTIICTSVYISIYLPILFICLFNSPTWPNVHSNMHPLTSHSFIYFVIHPLLHVLSIQPSVLSINVNAHCGGGWLIKPGHYCSVTL